MVRAQDSRREARQRADRQGRTTELVALVYLILTVTDSGATLAGSAGD